MAAVVVVLLIVLTWCAWDNSDIPSIIENITATVTCLTASVSLVFTSVVRDETNKRYGNDKRIEEELKWYQTLVLDRYLQRLMTFFDACQELVDKFAKINHKRGQLSDSQYDEIVKETIIYLFTKEYTAIHRDIVTDTQIIDSELSMSISGNFSSFQDSFSEYINMQHPNHDQMKRDIKAKYAHIVSTLMRYNDVIVAKRK